MWKARLGVTGEMGGAKFAWTPAGEDKVDEARVSGAANLTLDGWFVGRAMVDGKRAGAIGSGRVFAGRCSRGCETKFDVAPAEK